jgi:hypothetical protein
MFTINGNPTNFVSKKEADSAIMNLWKKETLSDCYIVHVTQDLLAVCEKQLKIEIQNTYSLTFVREMEMCSDLEIPM